MYFTSRKWKRNTPRRKRTWTSLLRTWRVSDISVLQHDRYTTLSIHYPRRKLESSVFLEEQLRSFINTTSVVSTLRATGWEIKMKCTEFGGVPHNDLLGSHRLSNHVILRKTRRVKATLSASRIRLELILDSAVPNVFSVFYIPHSRQHE